MDSYSRSFFLFGLPSLIFFVALFVIFLGTEEAGFGLSIGITFCAVVTVTAGFLTSRYSSPPAVDLGKEIRKLNWSWLGAVLFSYIFLFGGAVISFRTRHVLLGFAITLPVTLLAVYMVITFIEKKENVRSTLSNRLIHTITLVFSYAILFIFAILWMAEFDGHIIRGLLNR